MKQKKHQPSILAALPSDDRYRTLVLVALIIAAVASLFILAKMFWIPLLGALSGLPAPGLPDINVLPLSLLSMPGVALARK